MIEELFKKYKLVSDQVDHDELRVVLSELEKVLNKEDGNVVEFGCYLGTTSLFIRRVMDKMGSNGQFHVYDSFEGLPDKTSKDASSVGSAFKAGELLAPKKSFMMNFKKAGLRIPFTHKGWFKDFTDKDVPDGIIFAYLDGDFYESIIDSLKLVWNKVSKNGVIVIDDYNSEALPGVEKAVKEWQKTHNFKLRSKKSLAIITKN